MDLELIQLDTTTAVAARSVTHLNQREANQLHVELVKTESDDMELLLLQDKIGIIKSETVSTADISKTASSSTPEIEYTSSPLLGLKLETPVKDCYDESIKQELLHEELDIKDEDDTLQEPCFSDTYSENQLPKYTNVLSGGKSFKCNICDKIFERKGHLQIHLRIHTGEKPFKCNMCDKSLTQRCDLMKHLRTHTGEKPFKCTICDKCFSQKVSLQTHLNTHTGEKPFQCNICDRSFGNASNLRAHLRTHTEKKLFKCNICNRSFGRKGQLQRHLNAHARGKQFKCDESFGWKGQLQNNLKTYARKKQFKCNMCDQSFGQKGHLQSHLLTHSEEKAEIIPTFSTFRLE